MIKNIYKSAVRFVSYFSWVKFLFIVLAVILFTNAEAQYFNYGQEKPSVEWCKIEALHYRVVFPKGSEVEGLRMAAMLDTASHYVGKTLGHRSKRISIILHTHTATPLAFVGWAPSLSEIFTAAPQGLCSLDWLEILILHESRHMVQYSKIQTEMPRILRLMLGEQATPLVMGLYFPFWYIEGDAVCNESSLSYTGSGRSPAFFAGTRARLVSSQPYSYSKTYLGSYKDFVPSFYNMGYLMAGRARYLYDSTVWDKVVSQVSSKPLLFTPFNRALRKTIGITKEQLFDTVYSYYQNEWKKYDDSLQLSAFEQISETPDYYTNYRYPARLPSGNVFAEKTGIDDRPAFVEIDENGKEKRLFCPGVRVDYGTHVKDSLIVWVEYKPSVRWQYEDKTLLRLYNVNTGKLKEFKHKKRYAAPSLSPDNTKIAVAELDEKSISHIRIIDCASGEVVNSFRMPEGEFLVTPRWCAVGSIVACVVRHNHTAIVRVDTSKTDYEIILPFAVQEIRSPVEHNGFTYFIGSYSGIENLYSVDATGNVYMETSSRFGCETPFIEGDEILYSDYSPEGYTVVRTPADSLLHKPVSLTVHQISYPIADKLSKQQDGPIDFLTIDTSKYTIEKYRMFNNAVNIHSWGPFVVDVDNTTVLPGLSVFSQNEMGTLEMQAGYKYYTQQNQGAYFAKFKCMKWFPVIETSAEYGKKSMSFYEYNNFDTVWNTIHWLQADYDAVINVPLNLSKGKYQRMVKPTLGYGAAYRFVNETESYYLRDGYFHFAKAGFYVHHILNKSKRDLLYNWGIILNVSYATVLSDQKNNIFSAQNFLYLPGLVRNHGISVYNGFQHKSSSRNGFNEQVRLPRGYIEQYNRQLYTYGIDYMFPIWCPDAAIGKLIYFKRFKASLFYDQSYIKTDVVGESLLSDYSYSLKSCGVELKSDLNLLQHIAPFELGMRYSYMFEDGFNFKFLFDLSYDIY